MTRTIKLPDAMPEITARTLLVVCDAHHCKFFDVGGHSLMEKEEVHSEEAHHTDHQTSAHGASASGGKGGKSIGVGGDTNTIEEHRQKGFANVVMKRVGQLIREQKVEDFYLAAPGKFLSHLKHDLPKDIEKILESAIDGNFVKESPLAILSRFRPDLKASLADLHDQENYSTKNHLPK